MPWNEKGKYMLTTLKDLLKKHGFRSNKFLLIMSLFDLRNEKEGRCTSDLLTFLNCLKDEDQGLISNCDDGNQQKCSNDRKIPRIAPISTIFGPNESSPRHLFLEKLSKERKTRKVFEKFEKN